MFTPAVEVSDHGTGAVRSTDLAIERWDLISWFAINELNKEIVAFPTARNGSVVDNVAWSLKYVGQFLGSGDLLKLTRGWAFLALAIQKQDMEAGQYERWLASFNSESLDARAVPYYALKRLSTTCHEGGVKYGEHNWLNGFQVVDLCNHLMRHLAAWLSGDRSEDHFGHSMWNFMAATHMMTHRSDMRVGLLGPNYSLTPQIKETLAKHAAHRAAAKLKASPSETSRDRAAMTPEEKLIAQCLTKPNIDISSINGEVQDVPNRCTYSDREYDVALSINGSPRPVLCTGRIVENGDLVIKDFAHSVRTRQHIDSHPLRQANEAKFGPNYLESEGL